MAKLISEANVIPQSLYITNVSFDADHSLIGIGGYGRVLKGIYEGRVVALKMLDNFNKQRDLFQELCKEALVWRSLRHEFILPLLGIFKAQNLQFLVSPFMPNGTLAEWRKHQPTAVIPKIYMVISEVAQGVQYMHSNGIVHGFLTADNVLLDSQFHCKIVDFGLTRHSDATATGTLSYTPHYAAPELFSNCVECNNPECNGCRGKHRAPKKTMETDVYAFGCLYYAVFFGVVPYEGELPFRIGWLITTGERPARLENPGMQERHWELINDCWKFHVSERPTIHEIVRTLEALAPSSSLLPTTQSSTPPPLSVALASLLGTINKLARSGGSIVNNDAIRAMCKLLDLYESNAITSELKSTSDIELLLNFVLDLPRHGGLADSGIQEANQKVRKLTFKLISMIDAIPKFLYITNVKTDVHGSTVIGVGGFGHVYSGKYKGGQVALKVVTKGHNNDSLKRDFCREAVAWRSLEHRFILPLLGVFKGKSQLFLVSPLMNGTLTQWREKQKEKVAFAEIDRLVLEVAEGIQYLHAEEIVHGDLHGRNILLDSELHCRITDFGSMRHSGIPVTRSTTALSVNYSAPELFGMCTKCCQPECDGRHGNQTAPYRSKTKETDAYAFGCLYYETFFNKVPFHDHNHLQIMHLVAKGTRPARLLDPKIEDKAWTLIQSCMESNHSKRPTMEQIVSTLHSFAQARF
ncbi:kinase-like domain-containing protein [Amanita rubescens]|nr:kinase-like domain-containing protein [Amanita rubescens]